MKKIIIFLNSPNNKNKIDEFISKQSFILWTFIVFVVFHKFFESIINKYLVVPFFSSLDQSILNDGVFILLFFVILVRIIKYLSHNYLISGRTVLISFLLLLIIGYYRFFPSIWNFTSLKSLYLLKYLDIVLFFFIGNIIIRLFHRTKKYQTQPSNGFYFDNPIKSNDILNRNSVAEKIALKIKNTANPDSSFAIGITSEWGFGKTSFLNLIENHLDSKQRIIIHFNPWLNNDEKAIVKTFFDELSSKLKPYNKELSSEILKYAKAISSEKLSSLYSLLSSTFKSNEELRNQFENINEAIRLSGLQIVVFVDDLDRLYETEILEVLKLVRNSANFSNTIFVVANDRNYLISALSKANEYHPEFYLEKIFQFEIALPSFEKHVIKNKLKEQILPVLTDDDKDNFEIILSNSRQKISNYFHIQFLSNLRDVNRFTNSFIVTYEALKGETILQDLLNIELLKMKHLGVYNLLVNKYQQFLDRKSIQNNSYLTLAKLIDEKEPNKEQEKTVLADYLESNYKTVGIQKNQIKEVESYVYAIFPHYTPYTSEKLKLLSVANPISIDRYFHYNLLSSNLSEIEFSNYRRKSEAEFQEKITEWIKKGLQNEISDKLEDITFFESKDDYEKVIRTIFFFASIHLAENLKSISYDANNLIEKLQFKKVQDFYSDENEFHSFVLNVFQNQLSPYMFVSPLLDVIFENEFTDWKFILSNDELVHLKLTYFEQYTAHADVFDTYVFWLFNYCYYKQYIKKDNSLYSEKVLPNEAKEIFKSCALKLPDTFIMNFISPNNPIRKTNPLYTILKRPTFQVWESWENFELFIWSLDESKIQGLKEFKNFFTECKKVNFDRYIEFEFKEIDLTDALLFLNA